MEASSTGVAPSPRVRYADAPDPSFFDEALEPSGEPRALYRELLAELDGCDLVAVERSIGAELFRRKVAFGTPRGLTPFRVDPVPRLLGAEEWDELSAALEQRARALNAFVADVYGGRRIVAAGVVPARVLAGTSFLEPDMDGMRVPGGLYSTVAGFDVVRERDGRFLVLEDNLRTPSGMTYAIAAREAVEAHLPAAAGARLLDPRAAFDLLAGALRAAAPDGRGDPSIVLLSDGPANSAWYEHHALGARLGVPVVTLADLSLRRGVLHARIGSETRAVDVVYRRTDVDRLRDARGRPTAVGQALLEPCRRGTLACVNAFGTGVGDDKLVHAYVEQMVRFYLGEEPLVASVRTFDLGDPEARAEVLERLDELVVKPRSGHGGDGVVVCPHARREDVERTRAAIRTRPQELVAQETIGMSRHPTLCGSMLEPRHVDLRVFALLGPEGAVAVPAPLTRVAFDSGTLVVNSSQGGGGKDTWLLGASGAG